MPKKKTFEQALSRLEEIVSNIENNQTTLEESVKLYKEGIELSIFCGKQLIMFLMRNLLIIQRNKYG